MLGRRTKGAALVGAGLVLALGLTACGGGPSKKETIADGDAICRDANARVASIQKPGSYQQLSEAAGSLAAATDDQVTRLGRLSVPGDDKARLDGVFSSLRGVATAAQQLRESAGRSDDGATAAAAAQASTSAREAADQARAYGFTVCGSSTQTATATVVDGARLILKTAFVARAEAICLGPDEELGSLREPTDLRSLARFVDTLVPVLEKVVD
ncbi:MAG TPA: hypothetical protein VG455_14170, partial [Acidimicrobiales bacterium]|nr:hypothetical protein [Acidimicrobiales bacterium]